MGLPPRVIRHCQRGHGRWTDAVAAHVDLLGFGEWLAVGAVADDVVGRKTLGAVQFGGLEHAQASCSGDSFSETRELFPPPPAVIVGAGSSRPWPTLAPKARSMNALTTP